MLNIKLNKNTFFSVLGIQMQPIRSHISSELTVRAAVRDVVIYSGEAAVNTFA